MIFERWITAADSLGSFWSGFAAYSVGDLANVLRVCNEPGLASQLQQEGPSALCRLDMERRGELSAKVEPTLGAGLKRLLQSEAVEMERSLGASVPLRLVLFGRSAMSDVIGPVMDREFPGQRGIALFLERPSARHLASFENWRHQALWPEPQRPVRGGIKNLRRLPLFRNPDAPPSLMHLETLVRLRLSGTFHSSHASKPYVTFSPGEILRFGGLSLEALGENPFAADTSEVLIASGTQTYSGNAPIAFLGVGHRPREAKAPGKGGRTRVYLASPRETYGRIDFNPLEHKAQVSVHRTRDHRAISIATSEIHKDRTILKTLLGMRVEAVQEIEDAILMDLEESARTIDKRRAAHLQARLTVDTALSYAGRYLEWLEWHPESAVTERQSRLTHLEAAMRDDITPELRNIRPELLRRDLYRAFEHFLLGWGLG